jgi:tetratricopeptide (TPR) repeat protein
VLVLEDLHWADSALLEFFDYLVDWSSEVAMLVVCTARPELYERHPGWGGGKRNSNTISLSPLSDEETARLLSGLLARAVLPAGTQSQLLARSGGNPLYAEEFVRMLTDRGILTSQGELTNGQIPVPESVQALIAARLDTLPADRKALLYDAAVVGKVFWPGAIASIGGIEKSAAERGLRDLVRKELVRPGRSSSVQGEEEFSFWHLLVRDVAYGQIPRATRAEKHRAAAEWIEEIAGQRIADQAELVAEHYRHALELARTAHADDASEELQLKAARFLALAGERALDLDLAKAERHFQAALELVPAGTHEHARLLEGLASASPRVDEQNVALRREAVLEFRALNDDRATARAMAHLGRVLWRAGRTRESDEVLEEALALAERQPGSAELADVYTALAGTAMTAGRAQDSLAWAEKGLPIVESLNLASQKARFLQFVGASRCMLGDPGGLDDLQDALALGIESGTASDTALAYVNLAGFELDAKGPRAALPIYQDGGDFAARRGLSGHAEWAWGESTWALFELGEWDEVIRRGDRVADDESQLGILVRTQRARVLVERGTTDAEAAELSTLLRHAREIGDSQILVPALVVAATAEASSGRGEAAVELLDELQDATCDQLVFRYWYFPEIARICVRAKAREVLASLLEAYGELGMPRFAHLHRTAAAYLEEVDGHFDEAAALWAKAASGWKGFGGVVEEAHALLGRGRCLGASSELDAAKATFERLGARPYVAEADRFLERRAAG